VDSVGITSKKVNYVVDLDIRSFFDKVGHDHLEKFVRHRIGDERPVLPTATESRIVLQLLKERLLNSELHGISRAE
jgi:retron-type reverse transcriptase